VGEDPATRSGSIYLWRDVSSRRWLPFGDRPDGARDDWKPELRGAFASRREGSRNHEMAIG